MRKDNTQCLNIWFSALFKLLADNVVSSATDDRTQACIVCTPGAASATANGDSDATSDSVSPHATGDATLSAKFGKLSTVVKSRSAGLKDKMINYIKNEQPPMDKWVWEEFILIIIVIEWWLLFFSWPYLNKSLADWYSAMDSEILNLGRKLK